MNKNSPRGMARAHTIRGQQRIAKKLGRWPTKAELKYYPPEPPSTAVEPPKILSSEEEEGTLEDQRKSEQIQDVAGPSSLQTKNYSLARTTVEITRCDRLIEQRNLVKSVSVSDPSLFKNDSKVESQTDALEFQASFENYPIQLQQTRGSTRRKQGWRNNTQ